MNRVVINADDFGISDGVCRAIIELLNSLAISSTSIMVNSVENRACLQRWRVKDLSGIAGVHLQLTDTTPICDPSEIPSIINCETGLFYDRKSLASIDIDPNHVKKEWLKQIEVASDLIGTMPSHLDSHHGVHRMSNCSNVYLSIASDLNIPVRGWQDIGFLNKMKSLNVKGSSYLIRDWTGENLSASTLIEMLLAARMEVSQDGIIEVVTHPGYSDSYLENISSLNKTRYSDYIELMNIATGRMLRDIQFELVSFTKLFY